MSSTTAVVRNQGPAQLGVEQTLRQQSKASYRVHQPVQEH
jgi:hypothetical protein